MPNLTTSPDFAIRTVTPAELHAGATGNLSLPPDFWEEEGPGTSLEEDRVTPLAAFAGERMLGYTLVREITRGVLGPQVNTGLHELLDRYRGLGRIGAGAVAAVERPGDDTNEVIAHNLAFTLVGERGQGVGTALTAAALAHAGRNATTEQPVPAYLSVVPTNPARHLYERMGFEPMTLDGAPFIRTDLYYLPPSPEGTFDPPTMEEYVLMGTVLTGESLPPTI
jgi:GNAT superfamily N-acetyltransferase